jgi:hypothetical protein
MVFKSLTLLLALLLMAESAYILLLHRRVSNRFKIQDIEGYELFVAFDTATGQLCKTARLRTAEEMKRDADKQPSFLDRLALKDAAKDAASDMTLQAIANLPTCVDIR